MWISNVQDSNKGTVDIWIQVQDMTWNLTSSASKNPKSDFLLAIQRICGELEIIHYSNNRDSD
jgi:hypothetical protein